MNKTDDAILDATAKVNGVRRRRVAKNEQKPVVEVSDAERFKDFVEKTNLSIVERDKKVYLLAEAWQYIMDLKHLRCRCDCTQEVRTDGSGDEYLVVTCLATIYDENNVVISTGTMQATGLEKFLLDKPDFAVYGLAQTRAISRAMRNRYGYLARACGFQSTPIEEING